MTLPSFTLPPPQPRQSFSCRCLAALRCCAAHTPSSPLPQYLILKTRVTCRGAAACAPMSPTLAGVQLKQYFRDETRLTAVAGRWSGCGGKAPCQHHCIASLFTSLFVLFFLLLFHSAIPFGTQVVRVIWSHRHHVGGSCRAAMC